MSIALSLAPGRSRQLLTLLTGWALLHGAAALGMLLPAAPGLHGAPVLAGACLLAAGTLLLCAARTPKVRRIDVSGLGELRLTVQQSLGGAEEGDALWELLPHSVLWPRCLVLRLASSAGERAVLVVLPDGVVEEQFRHLAVALRTVAGRDNKFFIKHKIL